MKLKKGFIHHQSGNETLLVATAGSGFGGLVRGNRTLGAILELLGKDVSEEQLTAALEARFDAPTEVIRRDVGKALATLREIGALEEQDGERS